MSDERDAFALAFLRHNGNAYAAARELFPGDVSRAIIVSETYPREAGFQDRLAAVKRTADEDEVLPSKAMLAEELWNIGTAAIHDVKDRLAALKLYADIRGFVKRPEPAQPANITNNTQNVLVVPAHGNGWESAAIDQQAKLINAK